MLKHYLPFRRLTVSDLLERDIYETELAFHDAKLTLERAQPTKDMFEERLKRLKSEQNENTRD